MVYIGYLKLWRQTLANPIAMKDAEHLAIWTWLLMEARFAPSDAMFEGKRITLQPGQLIVGRKKIATLLNVKESKVQRVLKRFENEHMIEQQTTPRGRLITILSWQKYQSDEQHFEQQVNNNRTTSEQQVNTIKRKKERNNKKNVINSQKNSSHVNINDEDAWLEANAQAMRRK